MAKLYFILLCGIYGLCSAPHHRVFPSGDVNRTYSSAVLAISEVLVTEIMFDPSSSCPEYLEITNLSSDTLSMQSIITIEVGSKSVHLPFPSDWPPGCSRVFTSDMNSFVQCYAEADANLVVPMRLPILRNDGNGITLYMGVGADRHILDKTYYTPNHHNDFTKNSKGVSLERNILYPASNKWRSGFVQFQYRSPGFLPTWELMVDIDIRFSESVIYGVSQRGPGSLDIEIQTDGADGSLTIEVFDVNGRKIQTLANGVPVQGGDVFSWDGRVSGALLPEGMYLFWVYFIDKKGRKRIFKRTCILSNKYD